jgi:iron(II)-dependent oxidoreductase
MQSAEVMTLNSSMVQCAELLKEARGRTLTLIADLNAEQLIGPRLEIVNPLRWEIGHVAWFQEYWLLRHLCGRRPILALGDTHYDSAKVPHDTRWDLPLLSKGDTTVYMQRVLDQVLNLIDQTENASHLSDHAPYFFSLALFHEDMHAEAITYTRQTLAYPGPQFKTVHETARPHTGCHEIREREKVFDDPRDALLPGGRFLLGSTSDERFVFDNELGSHEVEIHPFAISRTAVTDAQFAAFVDDGGYERQELWCDDGWRWRERVDAKHPVYWQLNDGKWRRRIFDQIVQLEDQLPALHINWYEADAFCRWAGRRLPTESEWEMAASAEPTPHGLDVRALPAGDSAFGCRQMIGNVWEWTASDFKPYPGFVPGPYKEYSEPWFGTHKVLRGGCWVTRSRLIHNTYRNFYPPDRRDVWAGFRTCALQT